MKPTVGMQATMIIGTDRYAYEVIEVNNARKITVRQLDAKNLATWPAQDWVYTSNENNRTMEVTKRSDGWFKKGCNHTKFILDIAKQQLDPHL